MHIILGGLTGFSVWLTSGVSGLVWACGVKGISMPCFLKIRKSLKEEEELFLCKEARWVGKRGKKERCRQQAGRGGVGREKEHSSTAVRVGWVSRKGAGE